MKMEYCFSSTDGLNGLNGKNKIRLSKNIGTNSATFSPNFQFYINSFSSATQPTTYTLNDANTGKELQSIENNVALADKLKAYNLPSKEFFVLKTEKGNTNFTIFFLFFP